MTKVWASEFSDSEGCYDNDLDDGDYYYAELSTNPGAEKKELNYKALGGLDKYHKLRISYKGESVIAYKGDKGRGGIDDGKLRRIDLHKKLAKRLGFSGLDYVKIEEVSDASDDDDDNDD